MTAPPAGLTLVGSPDGAIVTCRPLKREPLTSVLAHTATLTGVLVIGMSAALVPLRLLNLLPLGLPPLALMMCPVAALVVQALAAVRRDSSEMTLRVTPQSLVVEHRLLGMSVVTESFDLQGIRRFELDEQERLVIALREAPARYEPIPGLPREARTFLIGLLEDARQSGSRFARDELTSSRDAEAVARLAEISRTR